jgi:hypothetical protein
MGRALGAASGGAEQQDGFEAPAHPARDESMGLWSLGTVHTWQTGKLLGWWTRQSPLFLLRPRH